MELGLTFPLQRFLKRKPLPYGSEQNSRFCWDLHVIDLHGRKSLLAVHCPTRYTFVRFDVRMLEWKNLADLFAEGLKESLLSIGFSEAKVKDYLQCAEKIEFTRTHGRREVAFLNRAWEDVLTLDLCVEKNSQAQPLLDHMVNTRPSRCAGFEGLGTAEQRICVSLKEGQCL